MSNVSHISTVDRGLKMKIKRTKVGPNSAKNDTTSTGSSSKHEGAQKGDFSAGGGSTAQHPSTGGAGGVPFINGVVSPPGGSTGGVSECNKPSGSAGSTPNKVALSGLTSSAELSSKDKSPKVKAQFGNKKDKNSKEKSGGSALSSKCQAGGDTTSSLGALANGSSGSGSSSSGSNNSGSGGSGGGSVLMGVPNGLDMYPQITLEPRVAVEAVSMKRDLVRGPVLDDPYEFNAKVEDGLCLPPKKLKTDTKVDTASSPGNIPLYQDASTEPCTIGVNTESEYLGPCEPGTSVTLQGIVWQEQTDTGLLVVNVTWRDKTYVGTLLDATKNEWAPPRPNCDSPVSDFETRTPKGRGKRGRTAAGTPSSDRSIAEGRKLRKTRRGSNNNFQAPASPVRPESSSSVKRKARNNDESDSNKGNGPSSNKRSRSCSRGGASGNESPTPGQIIECPEPNCKKKYKHKNGLRYHRTHAHQQPMLNADDDKDDEEEDMDTTDSRDSRKESRDAKKDQQLSERAERAKAKEQRLQREKQREKSLEKDCSAVEDNIPLKAFSGRVNAPGGDKLSKTETSTASASKGVECNSVVTSTMASAVINAPSALPSTTLTSTTVSSKKKDGGPSMSVSLAVSKTAGAPGQVHQMAGCLGGQPVIPSSNTVQAPVIAVPPASVASTSTPIPITVAPLGSLDSKDKSKNKLAARPIVPAPTSMAMPSPGGGASQGLGPSSVHPPVSQGLKMIQPKPTIMGEYTSVNPSLADLKKEKKSKKKRDKEGVQGQSGGMSPFSPLKVNKDDMGRCDRPAVIKSVTSPPVSRPVDGATRKDGIPSIEVSKPVDSPRPCASALGMGQSSTPGAQMPKSSSDQMRSVQPPGLLKVSSPLHVSAGERKTPVTDDVQSPAYSDISDANDSSSPQQQESPKKDTDVTTKKDSNASNPAQDGNAVPPSPFGGMYFYNRSPQLFSPSVTTPHASPNSNKPQTQKDSENSLSENNRPGASGNEPPKPSGDPPHPENKDPHSKGPSVHKPEGQGPSQPQLPPLPPQQQQQQQQQQQHQQLLQQQQIEYHKIVQLYAHIRMLPQQAQSQYLAAYGMLEPYAQCILSQQDPGYRQMVERFQEQKRLQEQQGQGAKRPEPSGTPTHKQHGSRPPSVEHRATPEAGPSSVSKLGQSMYGPHGPHPERMNEGKCLGESSDSKESREQQTLREKQNENHQILKENIELKSQMDRGRQEMDLNRQKQEDRRMMYFQQKQMEQHRSAEKRKMEMHGKPPELKSNMPSGLLGMDSARHSGFPLGAMKSEDIKKEPVDHHRIKDTSRVTDSKSSVDDKKMVSDKSRSVHTDTPKSKPPDQPGIMGPVSSASASLNPPSAPPGQYAPYSFPVIPSHYGPMQVDPSHPMYRQMSQHMIGYAAAGPPAYIHPSQIAYRMGPPPPVDAEKDLGKGEAKPSGPPPSTEESGKGSSEGSQAPHFYSPSVHKIHELAHDKARARPGSASPAPAKPGDGDSRNSSISALSSGDKQRNSPPTQRHLHTHHHTHVLSGFYPPDPSFAMFAASAHGGAPSATPALQPPFSK